MHVSVVGAGYVGLVTAVGLAELGHEVVCVDLDEARVEQIAAGLPPFYEPGLEDLLARNYGVRLTATTDLRSAVHNSEITLIAVGTPLLNDEIDLSAVVAAARTIGDALASKEGYHVVVVKSTVVPGTTDGIVLRTLAATSGKWAGEAFGVGANPEFLTEGQAVSDFMAPDRIVLGALDDRAAGRLLELYESVPTEIPRLCTNPRTAEMIKYASNALLATMISFANEIGNLCSATGDIDIVDVMRGVHLSSYITPRSADGEAVEAPIASFLGAGCGFGGSCLPKDVRALISEGAHRGQSMRVLNAVIETNDAQPDEVMRLAEESAGDLRDKRVSVLGLAFKPGTDDTRESPAIPIIIRLLDRGAKVTVHDPLVTALPRVLQDVGVDLNSDLEGTLAQAEVVILVTRWDTYRDVPAILARLREPPVLVDGRRMIDKTSVLRYAGVGL